MYSIYDILIFKYLIFARLCFRAGKALCLQEDLLSSQFLILLHIYTSYTIYLELFVMESARSFRRTLLEGVYAASLAFGSVHSGFLGKRQAYGISAVTGHYERPDSNKDHDHLNGKPVIEQYARMLERYRRLHGRNRKERGLHVQTDTL